MKRPQPAELVAASDVLANFIRRDKSRYPADVMAALEKLEDESAYGGFDFTAPALSLADRAKAADFITRGLFGELPSSFDNAEREEVQALITALEGSEEPEGTDGPGGPVALTDWGGRVLGRFPTIASAEGFLSTSATIDPDHLHAGRYGIEAPHGVGADVEAVPLARALGFSCFWSMGGAYYAPPGVATTGNDSGKGWKGGFDSIEAAALAALATVDPEAVTISPASVPAPPEEEADDFPESLSAFTRGGEGERLGYVPRKPR